ncbi:MAG: ABC transporter permease [Actinomycetota bacterium]|nr:ABC transporter permease [Actinomycetota bacterium]MDQ3574362.1 ABC transporter permease [Actinomycetota bacterium]
MAVAESLDRSPVSDDTPSGLIWALRDCWTEASRHLRALPRNPEVLAFSTIQPVMFVLLFAYVFGGSINVPGYDDYKQFLIPGIFAQTVLFGSTFAAVGLAEDQSKGIADRLRSLPMFEPAVLIGRTFADLIRNFITFVVMLAVAFAIGFRFEGTLAEALAATLVLLTFAYAFAWINALVGVSVGSVEAANSASFTWIFPLTFVSSAFVDPRSMPSWLEPIARNNPFTVATNAVRALYNGRAAGSDLWLALAWAAGITLVFAFLASRKFTSSAR